MSQKWSREYFRMWLEDKYWTENVQTTGTGLSFDLPEGRSFGPAELRDVHLKGWSLTGTWNSDGRFVHELEEM